MKLHDDLLQWVLESVEGKTSHRFEELGKCEHHAAEVVSYHITMCVEAGYLDAEKISGAEERFPRYAVGNLTWQGQMALREMRSCG